MELASLRRKDIDAILGFMLALFYFCGRLVRTCFRSIVDVGKTFVDVLPQTLIVPFSRPALTLGQKSCHPLGDIPTFPTVDQFTGSAIAQFVHAWPERRR